MSSYSDDVDHMRWDELAAGYALDALEPDEQLAFTTHLAECARCLAVLDQHEFVAAQLGALASDDDADVPEWSAIRGRIVAEPKETPDSAPGPAPAAAPAATPPPAPTPPVVSLTAERDRRRPRRALLLSAAAGVVVLAAAAVVGWQLSRSTATPASVAACRHASDCSVVALRAGSREAAAVLVSAGQVRVQPLHLPPAPAGHMYVLWQLPKSGAPQPIGEFRDASGETEALPLVTTYDATAAFAISIESDATAPTSPSRVAALGQT